MLARPLHLNAEGWWNVTKIILLRASISSLISTAAKLFFRTKVGSDDHAITFSSIKRFATVSISQIGWGEWDSREKRGRLEYFTLTTFPRTFLSLASDLPHNNHSDCATQQQSSRHVERPIGLPTCPSHTIKAATSAVTSYVTRNLATGAGHLVLLGCGNQGG